MENFDEHIDAYIARHLAGETTPAEEAALQSWIGKSAENRQYFADLKSIWERSTALRPAPPRAVDTEAALGKVKSRLRGNAELRPLTVRSRLVWRAAAAVFLAAVAVYFLWLRNVPDTGTVIAATQTALTDTLTDGSVITVSAQSGLSFAQNFNVRERRVRLRGEARFKVASDTTRPFIVDVQDLEVRVVGTEFTVDNATDSSVVAVRVSEGKVRVTTARQAMLLLAGDAASYDKKTGILTRLQDQQSPKGSRMLWFDASPLKDVVQRVETAYGIKITLKNKTLEECLLTARYNDLSKEEVLDLITESFSLRLTQQGNNEFTLDGKGCGE